VIQWHLFFIDIILYMLALFIKRAKDDGQIGGFIPHLIDDGLSILQYVGVTIIFMNHGMKTRKKTGYFYRVFLNSSLVSKSTFVRVKSFVMPKKSLRTHILSSLNVMKVIIYSDI
jgi:hypothetical protein